MAKGKQQEKGLTLAALVDQNPLVQLQERFKEMEAGFRTWLAKQPIAIEAAVVSATGAVQGAAIGGIMGSLTRDLSSAFPPPHVAATGPEAMASFKQAQALSGGPLVQARNFAVMTGVNSGIACVLKRVRGVEDVQSSMVAAFGSGVMFSLVSGMGSPNQVANAVGSGLFFALVQGGIYQFGQKISTQPVEDTSYSRTKDMLKSLGLERYAKNFKKGMLTDQTLPLLTDSALKEIRIPPGLRLVILDHVQRDRELMEGRQ